MGFEPFVTNAACVRVPTWTIEHDQCEINTPNKCAHQEEKKISHNFLLSKSGNRLLSSMWVTGDLQPSPRHSVLRAGGYHLQGLEYDGRSCLGCHRNQVIVYLSTVTTKVLRWTRAYKLKRVEFTNEYIYLWWLDSYMMSSSV